MHLCYKTTLFDIILTAQSHLQINARLVWEFSELSQKFHILPLTLKRLLIHGSDQAMYLNFTISYTDSFHQRCWKFCHQRASRVQNVRCGLSCSTHGYVKKKRVASRKNYLVPRIIQNHLLQSFKNIRENKSGYSTHYAMSYMLPKIRSSRTFKILSLQTLSSS